jgi:putative transcriptional regulator
MFSILLMSIGITTIKTKKTTSKVKKTKSPYKSRLLASAHETAQDLHDAGLIDKATMREFDASCLTPVRKLSAEEIREIRAREGVSQPVFALYLNVTPGLVSQWERGEKRPAGASLKLLSLIEKKGLIGVA